MYERPVCWRTVQVAKFEFGQLKSRAAQFRAVRRQILIRYLGLGWEEAYHAWSHDNVEYEPEELFEFFCEIVIPLSKWKKVPPDGPPVDLPAPPEMNKLGTLTDDENTYFNREATLP